MSINKQNGDKGELEVINLVCCPNCGKKLMILPPNYPLYDIFNVRVVLFVLK